VSEELAHDFLRRFPAIPAADLLPRHRHLNRRAVAAPVLRGYRRGDRNSQQHAGLAIMG